MTTLNNWLQASSLGVSLKRVLVPTDFSDASEAALPHAIAIAREFGATVTLVYVFPTALTGEQCDISVVLEQMRLVNEAKTRLAQFLERELPANLLGETLVLDGVPAQEIVRFAKDSQTDLIVIATNGPGALEHARLGSTSERVVRDAPCPVLVVREREDEFVTLWAANGSKNGQLSPSAVKP